MATESIFKDVEIKTKESCQKFVKALENAEMEQGKKVDVSYEEVKGKKIKEMFGADK